MGLGVPGGLPIGLFGVVDDGQDRGVGIVVQVVEMGGNEGDSTDWPTSSIWRANSALIPGLIFNMATLPYMPVLPT